MSSIKFQPDHRAKRLDKIRSGLALVVLLVSPHLVIALFNRQDSFSMVYGYALVLLLAIGGIIILRRQISYTPVDDIRLRQFNPTADWHQIWVWLKRKQNRPGWGEPKQALNEVLQVLEQRQERMIQVKRNNEWLDAGFVMCHLPESEEISKPPQNIELLVGEPSILEPGAASYIRHLFAEACTLCKKNV